MALVPRATSGVDMGRAQACKKARKARSEWRKMREGIARLLGEMENRRFQALGGLSRARVRLAAFLKRYKARGTRLSTPRRTASSSCQAQLRSIQKKPGL